MATMYARSTLTTWNLGPVGWSNTSGGADNGLAPDATTDVIFDANSGAARSIAVAGAQCLTLNMTGANAITFTDGGGGGVVNVRGNANLGSCTAARQLNVVSGSCTLTAPLTIINFLTIPSGATVTMASLLTSNNTQLNGGTLTMGANNYQGDNISFASGATLNMGSGSWTLWGSTPWNNASANPTLNAGTSTLNITFPGASGTLYFPSTPATLTLYNFRNRVAGGCVLALQGTHTYNRFRADPWTTTTFQIGSTYSMASTSLYSQTGPITLRSSSAGTQTPISYTGGGSTFVDKCVIKDLSASPANAWVARSSTDQGNNSGWRFVPPNTRFMTFF